MTAPAIRGVLFDKDGTLIDFFQTWAPAYEQAAHHVARGDARLAEHLLTLGGRDPATKRFRPESPLASGTNEQITRLWAAAAGHAPAAGPGELRPLAIRRTTPGRVEPLDRH